MPRSSKGEKLHPLGGSNERSQDNGGGQSPQQTNTKLRSPMAWFAKTPQPDLAQSSNWRIERKPRNLSHPDVLSQQKSSLPTAKYSSRVQASFSFACRTLPPWSSTPPLRWCSSISFDQSTGHQLLLYFVFPEPLSTSWSTRQATGSRDTLFVRHRHTLHN